MRRAVCTLVLLLFRVGVNGWNPFNRTKTNISDATTEFEEYIRNIPRSLYEIEPSPFINSVEAEAEGDLEDVQLDKTKIERILGETPTEVDAYRVSSIAKRAVQTKKVSSF